MRPMCVADLDTVLAIEQAVQPYPWTRGNFADALSSGYLCQVAEKAGEVCGFAVLMPGADEAEVLNIAVSAAHQQQGIGRAMLAAMRALAEQNAWSRIFLEVRVSNLAATALYRRAGFVDIGLRRGYYRNRDGSEDARVMVLELSGKSNG